MLKDIKCIDFMAAIVSSLVVPLLACGTLAFVSAPQAHWLHTPLPACDL